ncbi:MAG TPA: 1-deoxy-D-xylulose-5-phosphate reductoisomerase [Candidatus Polarisedimenticolia bacterium]|jgi:1-deoxy-D-xylulose-5-phosphate reductoisomerase|nr:1-deoxy-D-xylulose-5-phosphate reductoisomerase [Candidatus Polarisedimenticolia bacterium]
MSSRTRIAILGSTGSVGVQALDLISRFPDRFEVVALAARRNAALLAGQVERFHPRLAVLSDAKSSPEWVSRCASLGVEAATGEEGLRQVAAHPEADRVVCAIVGGAGLRPTLGAIQAGKTVALANKETLVMAGSLMLQEARRSGARLLPVDSEHCALHQCLRGERTDEVRRLILTASGGPFRLSTLSEMEEAGPEQALRHPTWEMGPKISVDSATLMNKGLEVIEAHWLFGIEPERIEVLLHPQSLVHSMVEMQDGSVICQMGTPDMRLPILYALTYPDRWVSPLPALDLAAAPALEFSAPDPVRFPCLSLAYRALAAGGTATTALNAANEIAVAAFLARRARLLDIPRVIEKVLEKHAPQPADSLSPILEADRESRRLAEEILMKGAAA